MCVSCYAMPAELCVGSQLGTTNPEHLFRRWKILHPRRAQLDWDPGIVVTVEDASSLCHALQNSLHAVLAQWAGALSSWKVASATRVQVKECLSKTTAVNLPANIIYFFIFLKGTLGIPGQYQIQSGRWRLTVHTVKDVGFGCLQYIPVSGELDHEPLQKCFSAFLSL